MKYEQFNEPWKYHIFDDFIEPLDYAAMLALVASSPIAKSRMCDDGRFNIFVNRNSKLSPVINFTEHHLIEACKLMNFPLTDDIGVVYEISICPAGYKYSRIFVGAEWKMVTFVWYLSPYGTGTKIYTSEDPNSYVGEMEWKSNRVVAFEHKEGTYRSYENNTDIDRITLNMILFDKTKYLK